MTKHELEERTKAFAIAVIRFVSKIPDDRVSRILVSQLVKSATSIGANYREGNRAESRKDFAHKLSIVEKEAAETQYWLELLEHGLIGPIEDRKVLYMEATQLLAIFTSIGKTLKRNTNSKFQIPNSKSPR